MTLSFKTLVVRPADVPGQSLGATSSTARVQVSVSYDRTIETAQGMLIPAGLKTPMVRDEVGEWSLKVIPGDHPDLLEARGKGAAVVVHFEFLPAQGHHGASTCSSSKTILVSTSDPMTIPLGSKPAATPVPPGSPFLDATTVARAAQAWGISQDAKARAIAAENAASAAVQAAYAVPDDAMAHIVRNDGSDTSRALDESFVRRGTLSGLLPWRAAYAQRASRVARVITMGSNDGHGATGREAHWTRRLERELRDQPGGLGWVPATYSADSIVPATTTTGVAELADYGIGLGGKALTLSMDSAASFPSTMCTGFTVWWSKKDSFIGNASVIVDGSVVGTLSGDSGADQNRDGQHQTFDLERGTHTVSIVGAGGGPTANFYLSAIEFFDGDATTGVHVADGTHHHHKLKDMTTTWHQWDVGHWQAVRELSPDLVIVNAGDWDWLTNNVAFIDTSINDLIDKIDEHVAEPHSILLALPPQPVPSSSQTVTAEHYPYLRHYLQGAALASPDHVAFVDLGEYWPRLVAGGATNSGLMVERDFPQNYTDAGNALVAHTLAGILRA